MEKTGPTRFVAVDVGNSRLGLGAYPFSETTALLPEPEWHNSFLHAQLESPGWLEEVSTRLGPEATCWFVASVHRPRTAWLEQTLKRFRPNDGFHVLSHNQLDIEIALPDPARVGIDRLAAALAVNQIREQGRPAIVIDSGSAVTVDLLDKSGRFCGGAILPGQRMAASALARQTDLLPDVRIPDRPHVVGTSTAGAIASGVHWGTVGAVKEIIARIRKGLEVEPQLFLTGGGVSWRDEMAAEVVCRSDLVLAGVASTAERIAARSEGRSRS